MKADTWIAWLYSFGLAGACLSAVAGCGGGDVPDASDSAMLAEGGGPSEPAMPPPAAPPAAPTPATAPAPAATPTPAAVAQPGGEAAKAPASADAAEASPFEPVADAEPAAAKPENNSATAELLAIATAAPAPDAKAEGGAGAQGAGATTPGADGMMPLMPGGPGGEQPGAGRNAAAEKEMQRLMAQSLNGGPGAANAGSSAMPADRAMQNYGGGSGGSGGDAKEEGDTKSPDGAVKAFLSALKAKDRDRLAEATALRAASAAEGGKHRDVFARIIDSSISDNELDEIAAQLDDFKFAGFNQVQSTGRLKVTTRKPGKNGGWFQRTFTVRREKKGWGVLDIDAQVEFHGNGRMMTNQGGQAGSGLGSGSGSSSSSGSGSSSGR